MELKLKLEFIIKLLIYISQSTGNQQNQVYRYNVKWCSLCFLSETEMDAIKKAFNQADTPSSTNFDTITLSKNTLIYS